MPTSAANVTDTASAVLAASLSRRGFTIRNFGTDNAYVSNDPAITDSDGFPILPGEVQRFNHNEGGVNAHATVYAICAAGDSTALRLWTNP